MNNVQLHDSPVRIDGSHCGRNGPKMIPPLLLGTLDIDRLLAYIHACLNQTVADGCCKEKRSCCRLPPQPTTTETFKSSQPGTRTRSPVAI